MADRPPDPSPAWARGMVAALARGDHRYILRTAELALDGAAEQPGLLARVHTWIAQAWMAEGDTQRARDHIRLAIRAVKLAEDPLGLQQIRDLRRVLLEDLRSDPQDSSHRFAKPPPTLPPPPDDTPAGQACKALAAGDQDAALRHATSAREAARRAADPRDEVIALLVIARLPGHADAALRSARDVADHSGDHNLVAAVARAARELGVDLGVRVF